MSPAQLRALAKRHGIAAYWSRGEQLWYFYDERSTMASEYFCSNWAPQTIKMLAQQCVDRALDC